MRRHSSLVRTLLVIAIVLGCTDNMPTAPKAWIDLTYDYDAVAGRLKVCNFSNAPKTFEITLSNSTGTIVSTVPLDQCDIVWQSSSEETLTATITQRSDSVSYLARTLLYVTGESLLRSDFPDRQMSVSVSGARGAAIHFKNELIGSAVGMSGGLPGSVRACNVGPRTDTRIVTTTAPSGIVTSPVTIPDEECVVVWRRAEGSSDTVPVTVTQHSKEVARVARYSVQWSHQQADTVIDPALATVTLAGSSAFGSAILFENDQAINANWPIRGHVKACNFPAPGFETTATRVFDVLAEGGIVSTPDTLLAYECRIVWQATDTTPTKVVVSRRPLAGYSMPYLLRQVWNAADERVDGPASEKDSVVVSAATGYSLYFKASPTAAGVPALPPDSIPASLYSAEYWTTSAPQMSGRFVRNLVVVAFDRSADQARRQALIDTITGSVVGGEPAADDGDGYYYVRVPDSPDGAAVFEALARLRGRPEVLSINIEQLVEESALDYRLPSDDQLISNGWTIDPGRASGQNWAFEAIAAPLAWGCSIGDAETKVGVADAFFHSVPDNALNVEEDSPEAHRDVYPADWQQGRTFHGDAVTSAIAATTNNNSGAAGMMWRARVQQYDVARAPLLGIVPAPILDPRRPRRSITQLGGRFRAKVISMSLGLDIGAVSGTEAQRRRAAEERGRSMADALSNVAVWWQARPLLILAAGNDSSDAWVNGYPLARNDSRVGDRILVVGATRLVVGAPETVADFSNIGPLVEITAPGDLVYVNAPGTSTPQAYAGTSISAPLVAGAAGLLFSFDPRLSAAEVKQLLIDGSLRGARLTQKAGWSAPLLNVYEALRLAARRDYAPLCGNRLFVRGGSVWVERGPESSPSDELVGLAPVDQASNISALHGGRRIRNMRGWSGSWQDYALESNQWVAREPDWDDTLTTVTGSYWSMRGEDHDGANGVWVSESSISGGRRITLTRNGFAFPNPIDVTGLGADTANRICRMETDAAGCGSYVYPSSRATWSVALSPTGDRAFVAIRRHRTRIEDVTGLYVCGFTAPEPQYQSKCRDYTLVDEDVESSLYVFDLAAGSRTLMVTQPRNIGWMSVAESDREMTLAEGRVTSRDAISSRVVNQNGSIRFEWYTTSFTYSRFCQLSFRNVRRDANAAELGDPLRVIVIPDHLACGQPGSGTAGPSVVGLPEP